MIAIARESDATWVLPTTDEWYKAAFYEGTTGIYCNYPTGTDTMPGNDLSDPDSGNNANVNTYNGGSFPYTTEVGECENSASLYGTFDQGGNVWEWTEGDSSGREIRGGSYFSGSANDMHAQKAAVIQSPTLQRHYIGFRVASMASDVPEPGSITLLLCGVIAVMMCRRRRK